MQEFRPIVVSVTFGLIAFSFSTTTNAQSAAPTGAQLAAASAQTIERIRREPISWTVEHKLQNGATIVVHSVLNGDKRLREIFAGPGKDPLIRIIARDG